MAALCPAMPNGHKDSILTTSILATSILEDSILFSEICRRAKVI